MDHTASSCSGKAIRKASSFTLSLAFFLAASSPLVVFGQAENPLYRDITVTAVVLQSPLVYPDTPPVSPGPISTVTTSDTAIFRGLAYPGSVVSLLKNGAIVAETPAAPNGTFELRLRNLTQGTYSFGIRAEDVERLTSKLQTFSVYVTEGIVTVVDGIFIPPTMTSDKVEVKYGDVITFSGRSAPDAEVRLSFMGQVEILKRAKANAEGLWSYKLNSIELGLGDHNVKARSITAEGLSPYSQEVDFRIGDANRLRTKPSELTGFRRKCDLNNDNRVNLLDFSIMAFWYKRTGFPVKVDLSSDNQINLTDLSILAYCWTG